MIKQLFILVLVTSLLGCSSLKEKEEVTANDTVAKIDTVLVSYLMKAFTSVKQEMRKRDVKDSVKNAMIDTLQSQVIRFRFNKLELNIIQLKLSKLIEENVAMFSKLDNLKKENTDLVFSKKDLSSQLENERVHVKRVTIENRELKDAIKLTIASVSIKAYSVHKIFSKQIKTETTTASKVRQVIITFVIVASDKVDKKTYVINTKLQSLVKNKDITESSVVNYIGLEQPISVSFNPKEEFLAGTHQVFITLEKQVLFTGSFTLK